MVTNEKAETVARGRVMLCSVTLTVMCRPFDEAGPLIPTRVLVCPDEAIYVRHFFTGRWTSRHVLSRVVRDQLINRAEMVRTRAASEWVLFQPLAV